MSDTDPDNSFFRPTGPNNGDVYFLVDAGGVHVSPDDYWQLNNDAGLFIDSVVPDDGWVFPYHRNAICAAANCGSQGQNRTAEQTTSIPFVMPVDAVFVYGQPLAKRLTPALSMILSQYDTVNWTENWLTLAFAPETRLEAQGSLSASGLTFTASDPAQGWSGIRFEAGSRGTISNSVVKHVKAYGNAAVTIDNASPTIRDSRISDAAPCCGVVGVSIAGSSAQPLLERNEITGMSQGGIRINNGAQPRLVQNRITNNIGDGISAGFMTHSFLAPEATSGGRIGNDILNNGSIGVWASMDATVTYSWASTSGPGYHNDGYNNVVGNSGAGSGAAQSAAIVAGNSTDQRRNGFYGNAQGYAVGKDAYASGSGARAFVSCNYWGPESAPPFRTSATNGGMLSNTSYLAQDPRQNPFAPCIPTNARMARSAGGDDSARSAGEIGDRSAEGASTQLADAAGMSASRPADALRALQAALSADRTLTGAVIAEVGQIAAQRGAPPAARAMLETYAAGRDRQARASALRALVSVRRTAGEEDAALAAADALTETDDADARFYGYIARVYLLADAGKEAEAARSLAAAEALEPGSRQGQMARSYLGIGADAETATAARARGDAETGVASKAPTSPDDVTEAAMGPARPNPTTGRARIPLALPSAAHVRLALYDAIGRQAAVLVDRWMDAGRHEADLQVAGLAPGVYVLRAVVAPGGTGSAVVLVGRVTVAR